MKAKRILCLIISIILMAIVFVVVLGPIILMFLLAPKKRTYSFASKYTEKEVINLVNLYVFKTTDDSWKYKYEIIETKPLEICANIWSTCKTIEGAYQYTVEVTDTTTGIMEAHAIVEDKYYENEELITPEVYATDIYYTNEYYQREYGLPSLLSKYESIHNYCFLDNPTKIGEKKNIKYGFIYATDTKDLETFFNELKNYSNKYYWDFIITNDEYTYSMLLQDMNSFKKVFDYYDITNTVYSVDMSAFDNDSNIIIENASKDGSTIVNSILKRKDY